MTKVKICGIKNLSDARFAVDYGADAIGFVFAERKKPVLLYRNYLHSLQLSASLSMTPRKPSKQSAGFAVWTPYNSMEMNNRLY